MTRSRASAKAAGSSMERKVADHLADTVDDRIDRRVKTGAKDKGDIAGLRLLGHKVVVEVKDYGGRLQPPAWVKEAHEEAENDNALVGLVVAKRQGTTKPGDQWVLMTLDDLVTIINVVNGKPKEAQDAQEDSSATSDAEPDPEEVG